MKTKTHNKNETLILNSDFSRVAWKKMKYIESLQLVILKVCESFVD